MACARILLILSMCSLAETPFGGVEETTWVQALVDDGRAAYVKAIVGSCDLGDAENVAECLSQIDDASPLVRGIRWILDYVGPFDGNSATHVNAARKDIDYLRGGEGGTVVPEFEEGYAMLSQYDFSFDAQMAPEQLPAMAELASRYPEVPVCLNHVGKPRLVLGPYSNATAPDEAILAEWRKGMKLMAAQPHVYVKLGMLGYMVPDWILDPKPEAVIKDLVIETIEMFGAKRCMFELNWYLGASISDNDGLGTVGPSPVELVGYMSDWLADYSQEDREWIFAKTAESFYKFEGDKNVIEDDENIDMDDANEEKGGSSDAFSYYCHGAGAAIAFVALASIEFMWWA